jgi:thioredoxin-related protein
MKILHIIIVLVITGLSAFAQKAETVKWHTIEEAQKLNEKSPRKILVDVYTDWCGWCKRMDKDTFGNPEIAKFINANFYPVKFDAESKEPVKFAGQTFVNDGNNGRTHQFAIALLSGKMSYPSVAYLTGELGLIGAVPGYHTPDQYESLLHWIVEDKYTEMSWEDYKKSFVSELKK